jgi:hypothetical protein
MDKPPMTPEQIAYYRECASRRRRSDRPCAVCGKLMQNALLKRRYCSRTCQDRALYQLHASAVLERQRAYRQRVKQRQTQTPDAASSSE